jgi:hypothetical protein
MARPRLQQRPVDREVLVRQQAIGADRREHFGKECVGDVAFEQPVD